MKIDPGEAEDLSLKYPNKTKEMIKLYEDYAERNGVIEILFDVDL